MKSGRVDAAINDNGVLYDFVKANPDVAVVAEFDTGEQYGFAAKKDDESATKLIDEVQRAAGQGQDRRQVQRDLQEVVRG